MSFRNIPVLNSDTSSNSESEPDLEDQNLKLNYNTNIILKNSLLTMAVLKKEYLDMLPEFNGERELLPRFIEISEKLVTKFYNNADPTDFQNDYLMNSIISKIKGEAAINIASCNIKIWADLKSALLNAFADKRDWFTLNIEMTELKQNHNESVFDFYGRLQHLLNLQISYISTHATPTVATVMNDYFQNYALRILLRGLKEPIGQLMRAKNPSDLNSALGMLANDFQFEHTPKQTKITSSNNMKPIHKAIPPHIKQYTPKPTFYTHSQPNNFQFNRNLPRPYNQLPIMPKTNQGQFASKNLPKPTPMSISTRNSEYRPKPISPRTPQRQHEPNFLTIPRYLAEELYNIDDTEIDTNSQYYCNEDEQISNQPHLNDDNEIVNQDENNFLDETASNPSHSPT